MEGASNRTAYFFQAAACFRVGKDALTPMQEEFRDAMLKLGYRMDVVYSRFQGVEACADHLDLGIRFDP